MKLIVSGGNGQLGRSLRDLIAEDYPTVEALFMDIEDLDITYSEAVDKFLSTRSADWFVNCAAYTAVDKAESEPEKAYAINAGAVKNIAEAAAANGMRVLHISTDYVFDGESTMPYKETDAPNPQSVYGKTKLEGERILTDLLPSSVIVRTAWLYSKYGKNFYLTMAAKAANKEKVRVINDQYGCPTHAAALAKAVMRLIEVNAPGGIYHFVGKEPMTWYEFTRKIYSECGADPDLVSPITTADYPTPARRPRFSVLDTSKITQYLSTLNSQL